MKLLHISEGLKIYYFCSEKKMFLKTVPTIKWRNNNAVITSYINHDVYSVVANTLAMSTNIHGEVLL